MFRRKREEADAPPEIPPHPSYPAGLGAAIWMMPDEDLFAAIDQMASSSQARGDVIGYYLDELGRREQRRINQRMLRLTWVIAALTLVVTVLTTASLIAVLND